MKASYRWIRELTPGLDASPEKLAARLTHAGLEVEGVHAFGAGIESCLVVRVVSMRQHPSRSSLRLVTVDRGDGAAPQEVVCGAPNVPEPGGLVVLAPLGAHLPAAGMTIEARPIGGVTSEGMLCSESELGIGDAGDGILVLPPGTAKPGARLVDAVPTAQDHVFEINVTANRPDALGHLGLAREAAALFEIPWTAPAPAAPPRAAHDVRASDLVSVAIEDAERCPHYAAAAVVDVTVGPSPLAVRYRLAALGVRSISNAVDVTNLVMLEYGHPMHAFDYELVRGARIVVRRAKNGERFTTLDGVERELVDDDLLICDAKGPVALAGVMGGQNSEIRATTRRVLLECAYFDPRSVRRTSRRHGLHTESSHRFERGVDHGDTARALARAAALTSELGGGAVAEGTVVTVGRELPAARVRLRTRRASALLGVEVPHAEGRAILERLGFATTAAAAAAASATPGASDTLDVVVPTHRPDVTREVDLIEEIARVRGIDAIPATLPAIRSVEDHETGERALERARAAGAALGLSEALVYGFTSRRALAAVHAPEPTVVLKNPLSEHHSVMRTSLLPGLLEAVARAARHGVTDARLFAIGALFLPGSEPPPGAGRAPLPEERLAFAAVLSGERAAWLAKGSPVDVWDAKAAALGFVERFSRRAASVDALTGDARPAHLHPRGAAAVVVEGVRVGAIGPLHPDVADAFEVAAGAQIVEIDVAALSALGARTPQYAAIPRFPGSLRDVALVVEQSVRAGEVERAVREAAGTLAQEVRLFDRFVGGAIPPGHMSLALRVVYRAADRTLTDAEVDAQHAKVVQAVTTRFGASLRA